MNLEEWHAVRNSFVRRMNALLEKAQAHEPGVLTEYEQIEKDFYRAVMNNGFTDWETEIAQHLRMLKWHCQQGVSNGGG